MSPWSRLLVVLCASSVCAWSVALYAAYREGGTTNGRLVAVRDALFARYVSDDALWHATPSALLDGGFRADVLRPEAPLFPTHLNGGRALDNVVALLREHPWNNGTRCATGARLAAKRERFNRRQTCCSDNTELFLAHAQYEGWFAREVSLGDHVVVEVWDPDSQGWVFVDPGHRLLAYDAAGRPLSLAALRECRIGRADCKITRVSSSLGDGEPLQIPYYDEDDDYMSLGLLLGANVFEVDAWRAKTAGWPYAAAQAAALLTGIEPRTVLLLDARSARNHRLWALRTKLVSATLATVSLVVLFAFWRRRAPRGQRRVRADSELPPNPS